MLIFSRFFVSRTRDLNNNHATAAWCELFQSTAEELRDEPGKPRKRQNMSASSSLLDCAYNCTSPSRRLSGDRAAPASAAAHIGSARGRTCTRKRVSFLHCCACNTVEIFDIGRGGRGGGRGPSFLCVFCVFCLFARALVRCRGAPALGQAPRSTRGEPRQLRRRLIPFWMRLTSPERCPSS